MDCCQPTDDLHEHSKTLDKKIESWMKDYEKTIKFLLLGAGESGKTTILKQMKILHIQGFSQSERLEKVKDIRKNISDAIKTLAENLSNLNPPEKLSDPSNEESLNYVKNYNQGSEFPQEFYNHAIRLWADVGIQKCYLRSNEFQLIDCAKYFLDKIHTVRKNDYVPTDQDILYNRRRTSEIQKVEFQVKIPKSCGGGLQKFWMFDVGGQRGERRKWIQVFDGITAVLFLVASSGFDMTIREDNQTNRLRESLKLFGEAWRSRFLKESGFILFLNKQDILEEKLKRGVKLHQYFQEYSSYTPTDTDITNEYEKARCFIRDLFLNETKKPTDDNEVCISDAYISYRRTSKPRNCYWHFTTATDTKNVKRVFDDVHSMIILTNLATIAPA